MTAWTAINGFHPLKPGEVVLVQGASSNVGTLLSRWARTRGAMVIGTASSETKRLALHGAVDHALLSSDAQVTTQIRALAPKGVDVVYEFVGKATFATSAATVRDGGTLVTIGAASGAPEVDQASLAARGVRIVGGPMAQHLQGRAAQAAKDVFDAYRSGVFGTLSATTYPLASAALAHADIAARTVAGPMLLMP